MADRRQPAWASMSVEEQHQAREEMKAIVAEDLFAGALNRSAAALTGLTLLALLAYGLVAKLPPLVHMGIAHFTR